MKHKMAFLIIIILLIILIALYFFSYKIVCFDPGGCITENIFGIRIR